MYEKFNSDAFQEGTSHEKSDSIVFVNRGFDLVCKYAFFGEYS